VEFILGKKKLFSKNCGGIFSVYDEANLAIKRNGLQTRRTLEQHSPSIKNILNMHQIKIHLIQKFVDLNEVTACYNYFYKMSRYSVKDRRDKKQGLNISLHKFMIETLLLTYVSSHHQIFLLFNKFCHERNYLPYFPGI